MKDGSIHHESLGRLVEFDEQSRSYPIRAVTPDVIPTTHLRSRTWRIIAGYVLDQGSEGACVGFGLTHAVLAKPIERRFLEEQAHEFAIRNIYWRAQQIDPWEGGAYPGATPFYEGTSVLAGIKAMQHEGHFQEYRWAFGIEDLILGLVTTGPAIMGLNWYMDCYTPSLDGYITPTGNWVGGHAILARAVRLKWKRETGDLQDLDWSASSVVLRNSWGPAWGPLWGDCLVSLDIMAEWLQDQGEVAFAVH